MTPSPRLEPLTPDNVLDACRLAVRPGQERYVAPVAQSIAEAYVHPETAWPRVIVDDGRLVGFVMAFFDVEFEPGEPPRSGLWRLAVADGEQGRGYGRFAVRAVAEEIRRRGGSTVTVTWRAGADGPEEFYRRLGFRPTGGTSGDDLVGELDLTGPSAG